ncbi:MAG: hypothetical protein FJZ58_03985 [Chlamydiae bacterium]|nr:hypothetical protein [Chlamydiota bacterium]
MQEALKTILSIQELDMKMIRLMALKKERQKELEQICQLRSELYQQSNDKEAEIQQLSQHIEQQELKLQEVTARLKKLESQQLSLKKADEFNAIMLEITTAEREKVALEQKISDLLDKKLSEEELFETIKQSLASSGETSLVLEQEVCASIALINKEGTSLQEQRNSLAREANTDLLALYERLLKNKKDRVVVPIENRTCTGCHIVLTAQHENLVRKGSNLTFCEHCSRIHFWPQAQESEEGDGALKKRRRRRAVSA